MGLKINYLEVIHLIIINIHILLYLLSGENIKTLSISLSKGHYDLKNIKTYSLNKEVIENRNKEVDSLNIQKGKDI